MSKTEVVQYIPHRSKMVLLDGIVNKTESNFCTETFIRDDSLLISAKGVPSYCAIEYMAQSIAAFNTIHYSDGNDKTPKLGFIVSVRNFRSFKSFFEVGTHLKTSISPVLIVKNSGSFNCEIRASGEILATARITAYVPTEEELSQMKKE